MNNEVKDYLEYVQNVLGGKMYIQDPAESLELAAPLKVRVLVPLKPTPEEFELLGKILSAIKVQDHEFAVQTWDSALDDLSSEILFIFGAGIKVEHPKCYIFPTLTQLSTQPELKKSVWNQIKHLNP